MNSMPLFQPTQKPRPRPALGPPLRPTRPILARQSVAEKLLARSLARLTPDQRTAFEERLAICIHDGGLPEAEAIRVAANAVPSPERPRECEW